MGIFDAYQLSNSKLVPQYQGSTVPELTSVATEMQRRYDTGQQYDDMIDQSLKNAQAAPFDDPMLESIKAKYRQRLSDRAASGDYENMWRDTMLDSRDFMNEYRPIVENAARFQDYRKNLETQLDKGYLKTPDTVDKLIRASAYGYTGLKKDPTTGQYSNKFQGIEPAKEIDLAAKTDEWMKNFAPTVLGSEVKNINGDYYITHGNKTTRLTQPQIDQVLSAAKQIDPEYKSYVNQQKLINTVGYDKLTPDDVSNDGYRNQISQLANQHGLSFGQAAQTIAGQNIEDNLFSNMRAYAGKYRRNDQETKFGMDATEDYTARIKKKYEDEHPVLMTPDGEMKLTDAEKDPATLRTGMESDQATMKDLLDKLQGAMGDPTRYHPDDVREWRRQLSQFTAAYNSKKSILAGAQDDVARDRGYKNYADYNSRTLPGTAGKLNSITIGNDVITADDLRKPGSIRTSDEDYNASSNDFRIMTGASSGHYAVTITRNGVQKEVVIPADSDAEKVLKQVTPAFRKIQADDSDFTSATGDKLKANGETYAVKPIVINAEDIDKTLPESLKTATLHDPSAFEWYKPGSSSPMSSPPDDYKITGVKVMKDNGSVWLSGYGLSTKAKHKGEATGDNYNIKVTPGSNYGQALGQQLLKADPNNKDAQNAANILMGSDWSGRLMGSQYNDPQKVTTADGEVMGSIEKRKYEANPSKSRFIVRGSDGKELDLPEDYRTDATKLSQWIDQVLTKREMEKAGQVIQNH